jgi:hypothetical protein
MHPHRYRGVMLEDDEDHLDEDGEPHAEPAGIHKFKKTSLGTVFAAGLMGLRDVFEEPKPEDPPYVQDWSGSGNDDDPIKVELDFENPAASVVRVRRPTETTD